jgi:hypothetical protein
MPPLLRCIECDFLSIYRYKECPKCWKKYAVGQIHYKHVTKWRYRGYHMFFGLLWTALGVFLGVTPFVMRILYQQKILITEGVTDYQSLVFIGAGLFFITMGISSWYKAIFKSHF